MQKYLVIYHKNCPDGFTSAWIAHRRLGNMAKYLPMAYGDDIPDVEGYDTTYILDFSWPLADLVKARRKGKVVLIDHHKTALDNLGSVERDIVLDMSRSGAALTWQYFYPRDLMPAIVLYVEDRDLWKFELKGAREISAVIRSTPFDFHEWAMLATLLEQRRDYVISIGENILRYETRLVESAARNVHYMNIGPHVNVPVANSCFAFSDIADRLLDLHPKALFTGVYYTTGGGKRKWSLRSRPGFDVSEVAKLFGGGGHPQAAGFEEDI